MLAIKSTSNILFKYFFAGVMVTLPQLTIAQQASFGQQDKLVVRSKNGHFVLQVEQYAPYFSTPKNWSWGADGKTPARSISKFNLKFKGQDVYVPLSAFIDLGEPEKLELIQGKKYLEVKIFGGQTSTAYEAVLIFDGKRIQRRTVCNSEFPDDSCEKTVYSYPTSN